jgi:peroxiredoxin Q/BCP
VKLFVLINSILFISALVSSKTKLTVGMKAPEFELLDQDSTLHKLTDYQGSTVVLYFFPMADTPG